MTIASSDRFTVLSRVADKTEIEYKMHGRNGISISYALGTALLVMCVDITDSEKDYVLNVVRGRLRSLRAKHPRKYSYINV